MPVFPRRLFGIIVAGCVAVRSLAQDATPSGPVEVLPAVHVVAGAFPIGAAPNALLNSLEIVLTPGTNADINRTLQTFPGVQLADDGNALFVRGGDSFETTTLVDGVRYPDAVRLDTPVGTYTGTISPFQADKITFLAGGYGARYGNTLSAIVDLTTPGVPDANDGVVNVSIGAVSFGTSRVLNRDAGIRVTATLFDLDPLFSLHAPPREFSEPPAGHDLSAHFAWNYRPGGALRSFLIEQETKVALEVNEPEFRGLFRTYVRNRLGTATLDDRFGSWDATIHAGGGTLHRTQSFSGGDVTTSSRHRQFNFHAGHDLGERLRLTTGADWHAEDFSVQRNFSVPDGGPLSRFGRKLAEKRVGGFVELESAHAPGWLVAGGLRADHSRLARGTTLDPRLRVSWQPRETIHLSGAAGIYHQVPDAYHYDGAGGATNSFPAMRASHALLGVQIGGDSRLLRVEIYHKDYAELVELTRGYAPVGDGTGRARGIDFLAKSPLPGGWRGRMTWSLIDSERTDPDTGLLVRSRQDITHTAAFVADRRWHGWQIAFAWRYASGRPFTPVTGGVLNAAHELVPAYGPPNSARLSPTRRVDFSTSRIWALHGRVSMVTYISINNIFNQATTTGYEYSADFTTRTPVLSQFARSVYFGATFLFR